MSRLCAWTTLLAVLAVSAPAVSRAEESARELFDKGTAAYALGHFDEAAQDYEKAFSLKPDPALLFNAAQAHRQASNKKRALVLYQNYIRLYGNRVSNRAEVERIEWQEALGALQQVGEEEPEQAETQQRRRIVGPTLLHVLPDSGRPVSERLEPSQDRMKKGALPLEDSGHEGAQGFGAPEDQQKKDGDLQASKTSHGSPQNFSGRNSA